MSEGRPAMGERGDLRVWWHPLVTAFNERNGARFFYRPDGTLAGHRRGIRLNLSNATTISRIIRRGCLRAAF